MLEFKSVNLYINDLNLFKNLNLQINDGEIHVLMGKNGIGKSSIAKTIMGDSSYRVEGKIIYNDKDITNMSISERASLGIYLVNQAPIQIEGVTNAEMLRVAVSEKTGKNINIFEFNKELEKICSSLELDRSFIHREINVGCSGGERKKIELMHMWMLKPSFIILDEIDSGLDVDAIKVVQREIKKYYEEYKPSIFIITHSDTFISAFDNFTTHVVDDGKIVKTGDKSLAKDIIKNGFSNFLGSSSSSVISENKDYE